MMNSDMGPTPPWPTPTAKLPIQRAVMCDGTKTGEEKYVEKSNTMNPLRADHNGVFFVAHTLPQTNAGIIRK